MPLLGEPLSGKSGEPKNPPERPAAVSVVAVVFLLAALYLALVGLTMLISPGTLSMALGADLLGGLETAGPYMFLLVSAVCALIGWGLLRLNNWARRVAIIAAVIGFVLLIPTVSGAVVTFNFGKLVRSGAGLIVRVLIVFYLYQLPVREAFEKG